MSGQTDDQRRIGGLDAPTPSLRPFCRRCYRAADFCVCQSLPQIANQTPVVIVQHPRERHHPLGTARLVCLALDRGGLTPWTSDTTEPPDWSQYLASSASARPMLLFPGAGSTELGEMPAEAMPSPLVLVDATWAQASHMVRNTPWLRDLPRVGITPTAPSQFRVRRPPEPHCLSTIEAVCQALKTIEPQTKGPDALFAVFQEMVHRQESFLEKHGRDARYHRKRPLRAVPAELRVDPSRVVLCLTEGVRRAPDSKDRLPLCVAMRRLDGSREELLVHRHTGELPTACHLEQVGVPREQVKNGLSPDDFARAFQDQLRGDDVLVTWTKDSLSLLPDGPEQARIAMRDLVRRVHPDKKGSLPEVAAGFQQDEALGSHGPDSRSRPTQWLDSLEALTELLRSTPAERE